MGRFPQNGAIFYPQLLTFMKYVRTSRGDSSFRFSIERPYRQSRWRELVSNRQSEGMMLDRVGWSTAQYPPSIQELHAAWCASPMTILQHLHEIQERMSLSADIGIHHDESTTDGYTWCAVVTIRCEGYVVAVALPHCTEYRRTDGTVSDRMSAVFTKGAYETDHLDGLIENMAHAFREIRATRYVKVA